MVVQIVTLIQHVFTVLLPIPLATSAQSSDCIWHSAKITKVDVAWLLLLLLLLPLHS